MRFEDFKSSDFQEKLMAASSPKELLATAKEVGLELTDEQLEKIAGKSPEEVLELAKAEGYELSDEELEEVSGGAWDFIADSYVTCSNCGKDTHYSSNEGVPAFCGFCGDPFTFSN